MEQYIGTKQVFAEPMDRYAAEDCLGRNIKPRDEYENEDGYLVVYEDGYRSWSPKKTFNDAYRAISGMTFGLAIEAAKKGSRISRAGWNGKGMFVVYMPPLYLPPFNTADTARKVNDRTAKHIGEDTPLDSQGYFAMFTAKKQWQPGWLASQADMLAEDWEVVV
ncbi:MAG: DUF2829 domain-containing protein [Phycisphaerae bacterium]|jgi:hypothetical protein